MIDVLIAGGGISGLAAARDLVRAGRRVRLVEARPRLGGMIQTEEIDGFTIEAGPDALLMTKPSAAALCEELGLTLVATRRPRTAFIMLDGSLHEIPPGSVLGLPTTPEAIERAQMLSPEGRARLMRDLTDPQAAADADPDRDESIGAVFRRRFGDEAVRHIAQPLLGGIHAGDVERLSLRALFPRIAALDREPGSLLEALARQRSSAGSSGSTGGAGSEMNNSAPGQLDADGMFRSLEGGLGTLVSAIARGLPADAVSLNASLMRLGGDGETSAYVATLSTGETLRARAVILALPAYGIASLVSPLDALLAELCRAIRYSSSATITLCYRREAVSHPLSGSGFVVPRGEVETRLLAVSWVTSKWVGRAPENMVMLRAFAGGTLDADLLERDDEELVAMSERDLAYPLGVGEQAVFSKVYRWMQAGPQYEVGHLARVQAIERRLARHPGLFVTGSGFRGIGIPDTVADARSVAELAHRWLDADSAGKITGA